MKTDDELITDYINKINPLIDDEKYIEARAICNDALEKFPKNRDFLEFKLMVEESKSYYDGVKCCDEILEIYPEWWRIYRCKAYNYIRLNDLENAIKIYDYALSLYIDEYNLFEEKVLCLFKFNEIEKANNEINMILFKYPNDPVLWNIIGNIYSDIDEGEKAIECYDRSLELELDSVVMENKLGSLLYIYDFEDSEQVSWDLYHLIREYDSKFISKTWGKQPFGVCKGKKMFEFLSVDHYLRLLRRI